MLYLDIGGHQYSVAIDDPVDLSIPLIFGSDSPNAFHLPKAVATVAEGEGFIGDTRRGGSCNCQTVTLNPHGNGTHTECVGHLSRQRLAVHNLLRAPFIPSLLVSVPLREGKEGRRVERDDLAEAIERHHDLPEEFLAGLVIRTTPNDQAKRRAIYSGTNPPYPSRQAMEMIRELGVRHLLLDLPSADREGDPDLTNHRIFWSMTGEDFPDDAMERTITEMVFVDDSAADGPWLMNLQIPPFMLDAAPSRPMLCRARAFRS